MSIETMYELIGVKPIDRERYERNTNDQFDYDENRDVDEAMKLLENLFD